MFEIVKKIHDVFGCGDAAMCKMCDEKHLE